MVSCDLLWSHRRTLTADCLDISTLPKSPCFSPSSCFFLHYNSLLATLPQSLAYASSSKCLVSVSICDRAHRIRSKDAANLLWRSYSVQWLTQTAFCSFLENVPNFSVNFSRSHLNKKYTIRQFVFLFYASKQ